MSISNQPTFSIGDKITQQFTVREIWLGGVSEVYGCTVAGSEDRLMVLKTLQPQYRAKLSDKIFKKELQIWIDLPQHTNIVTCYGVVSYNHIFFILLDYIHGMDQFKISLRDWVKSGPINPAMALLFMKHICEGLNAIKQAGQTVIHCDIKPENILIQNGISACITDFGLAKLLSHTRISDSVELTDDVTVESKTSIETFGTPPYMSPEQWLGQTLDIRSDIYALGCMFFELVTGYWPYKGPTIRRMRSQHLEAPIPKIPKDTLYEGIPIGTMEDQMEPLNNILIKCLAKDKTQRYGSVEELLYDLEALSDEPLFGGLSTKQIINPIVFPEIKNLVKVRTYVFLKNFKEALAIIQQAFSVIHNVDKQSEAIIYATRGEYYVGQQEYKNALQDYSTAIALDPDCAIFYVDRSFIFLQIGEFEHALDDCETALKIDNKLPHAYQNQAAAYERLERFNEALQVHATIIDILGDAISYDIHIGRGNCYKSLDRYSEAIMSYDKAIELNPQRDLGYYNRGLAYGELESFYEAIADFTQAITLNSEFLSKAYTNRAKCYGSIAQYPEALEDIELAMSSGLPDASSLITKATIIQQLGQYDAALICYNEAASVGPSDASLFSNRGTLHKILGNFDAALHDFDRAIELEPMLIIPYINKANLYNDLEQYDHALEVYDNAIKFCPGETDLYINRATILFDLHKLDLAWEDVNKALSRNPNHVRSLKLRGKIYMERKQYHDAVNDFENAAVLDPDSAATQFAIGILYQELGNYDQAVPYLNVAAQLGLQEAQSVLEKIQHRIAFSKFPNLSTIDEVNEFITEYPFTLTNEFLSFILNTAEKMPEDFKAGITQRVMLFSEILADRGKEGSVAKNSCGDYDGKSSAK